jgi:hypothetical protein
MTVLLVVLAAYVCVAAVYWLWMAAGVLRVIRGVEKLERTEAAEPAVWPRLSVIVPARDEADRLVPAARSLLAAGYAAELEVVLVDDRSTDGTGAAMDRLAAEDARVKSVHVRELPPGWLGKVHALDLGLREATGEFVLFTDADVHFAPGVLRRAVSWCVARRLDHLAVLPALWPAGALVDAVVGVFIRQFLVTVRPWRHGDAASPAFIGVGAFNLVRRSAFDAAGGFQRLRLEVADDMGVGLLMKSSGARCGVAAAFDGVGLRWYHSLADAVRGAEKAWSSVCRFSLARSAVLAAANLLFELAPVACLVPLAFPSLRAVGLAGLAVTAAALAAGLALARWARAPALPALLAPLAAPLIPYALLRAALLGIRRGGVLWRGTLYPTAQLRQGMRVRL